jgi:hypothetical protein
MCIIFQEFPHTLKESVDHCLCSIDIKPLVTVIARGLKWTREAWRNLKNMQTDSSNISAGQTWSPTSWQNKAATQQPVYPDRNALKTVLAALAKLPPMVTSWESENLKGQLAEAARGERFLLQGGDCSESFDDCEPNVSRAS